MRLPTPVWGSACLNLLPSPRVHPFLSLHSTLSAPSCFRRSSLLHLLGCPPFILQRRRPASGAFLPLSPHVPLAHSLPARGWGQDDWDLGPEDCPLFRSYDPAREPSAPRPHVASSEKWGQEPSSCPVLWPVLGAAEVTLGCRCSRAIVHFLEKKAIWAQPSGPEAVRLRKFQNLFFPAV